MVARFLAFALVWLVPSIAAACPYCSPRAGDPGMTAYLIVTTVMCAIPILMIGMFVFWLRRRGS